MAPQEGDIRPPFLGSRGRQGLRPLQPRDRRAPPYNPQLLKKLAKLLRSLCSGSSLTHVPVWDVLGAFGFAGLGVEIYVPASRLEEAKTLLESPPADGDAFPQDSAE